MPIRPLRPEQNIWNGRYCQTSCLSCTNRRCSNYCLLKCGRGFRVLCTKNTFKCTFLKEKFLFWFKIYWSFFQDVWLTVSQVIALQRDHIDTLMDSLERLNSLAPGRCGCKFKIVISEHLLWIKFMNTSCELALSWMTPNSCDDKSTLVQVMVWCHQPLSLSQYWLRSLWPYGVTRLQWVNLCTCINPSTHSHHLWSSTAIIYTALSTQNIPYLLTFPKVANGIVSSRAW